MMRHVTEYSWAPSSVRQASKSWAALAAAATVVGASLSLAASEAVALSASATAQSSPGAVISAGVTGLDSGKPELQFAIKTRNGSPITSVTVALPSGLSVSRNAAKLAHGVRATGSGKARSNVHKGQLIVTMKGNSPNVNLTVAGPALSESKALETSVEKLIAFNQANPSAQRDLVLKLTVIVDSSPTAAAKVAVTIPFR